MVRHVLPDGRWYNDDMVKIFSCAQHGFHQFAPSIDEFVLPYSRHNLKRIEYYAELDFITRFVLFNTHFAIPY